MMKEIKAKALKNGLTVKIPTSKLKKICKMIELLHPGTPFTMDDLAKEIEGGRYSPIHRKYIEIFIEEAIKRVSIK